MYKFSNCWQYNQIDRIDCSQWKWKVEHNALWYIPCSMYSTLFGKCSNCSKYSMHTYILYTKYRLRSTHCRNSTPFQTQPIRKAAWDSLTGRERDDYVTQHRRRLQSSQDTCSVSKDIFMFFSSWSRSMAPS